MNYKVAKVLGFNSDQQAAQGASFAEGPDSVLLILLKISSDDAFTEGRQLLGSLSDSFFAEEGNIPQRLSVCFKQVGSTDAILAVAHGKIFYLLWQGEMEAILKRAGTLSTLTNLAGAGQLISGFLEGGDKVLLATKSFRQFLGDEFNSLMEMPLNSWQEEIELKVESADLSSECLAAVMAEAVEEGVTGEPIKEVTTAEPAKFKIKLPSLPGLPNLSIRGKSKLLLGIVLILILILGIGFKIKNDKDKQKQAIQKEQKEAVEVPKIVTKKASFSLFLDLSLIKKDLQVQNLSLSSGKILLFDSKSKTLASINLDKKGQQIQAGKEQLGDGLVASINGGVAFIYSKDKGIVRVDLQNQKVSVVAKPDKEWGEIADIYGFAGNVYLLDKSGQVWKYLPITDGYSDKRNYLNDGVKVNFSSGTRMQIESSVYVLSRGGEMLRFTKGAPDFFSYGGLDKNIKDPNSFFVSSDTDNLYLLDSGNSRLLVLTKVGMYKDQYEGDKFAAALDLVVDEEGKKVYLLEGNKIYTMELQ